MNVGENAGWVDDPLRSTDCNAAICTTMARIWDPSDPGTGREVINVNVVEPCICHILATDDVEMVGRHSREMSIACTRDQTHIRLAGKRGIEVGVWEKGCGRQWGRRSGQPTRICERVQADVGEHAQIIRSV